MNKQFALCFILGFLLFLTSCGSNEDLRPKRDCPIDKLLLNQSSYPPGTILNEIISPVADKPLESADQSASYLDSGLFQVIIRYFSNENAATEYEDRKKSIFAPSEIVGLWDTPSTLQMEDLSADQYEIACGNVISFGRRCYLIGQYEEYYVFLRADISSNGVTYEIFRNLVLNVNDQMTSCLNK